MPYGMPAGRSPAGGNHRRGAACNARPHHRRSCRRAGWRWLPELWTAPLPRLPRRPSSAPCRLPWGALPSPLSGPAGGVRLLRNELAAVAVIRRRADDKPRGSHARDSTQVGGADGRRGIGDAAHRRVTCSRRRGVVSEPPVGDADPAGVDSPSATAREATTTACSHNATASAAAGPCAIATAHHAPATPRATDHAAAACNATALHAETLRAEAAAIGEAWAGSREGPVRRVTGPGAAPQAGDRRQASPRPADPVAAPRRTAATNRGSGVVSGAAGT
jgi:hypothetical protein